VTEGVKIGMNIWTKGVPGGAEPAVVRQGRRYFTPVP
jgi:hypothetical protein